MEPPRIPSAPTEPNAWGDGPAARATMHKGRTSSAKTRRERGDNANGIDKRGRCQEKAKARSGYSKRAAARPSAKAEKDSTKKERGMEWVSDSDWASNRGTYARQVSDPGKGRTLERAQNSLRLAATVRTTSKHTCSYRARTESSDRGSKPIRKEIGLSTNDNLRWEQVQSRWSLNRIIRYGRTMERAKNSRRLAASARTTRKNAPAAAGREEKPQTEARTPSGRI